MASGSSSNLDDIPGRSDEQYEDGRRPCLLCCCRQEELSQVEFNTVSTASDAHGPPLSEHSGYLLFRTFSTSLSYTHKFSKFEKLFFVCYRSSLFVYKGRRQWNGKKPPMLKDP